MSSPYHIYSSGGEYTALRTIFACVVIEIQSSHHRKESIYDVFVSPAIIPPLRSIKLERSSICLAYYLIQNRIIASRWMLFDGIVREDKFSS